MEATRTCATAASNFPRRRDLQSEFTRFGLLYLLVASMVSLLLIGKAAVPGPRRITTPSSDTAMVTSFYAPPAFYGRAPQ